MKVDRLGRREKRAAAWQRSEVAEWARSLAEAKGSAMAPETVRWAWICLIWVMMRHGWFRKERIFFVDLKYLVANVTTIPLTVEMFYNKVIYVCVCV